MHVNIVQDEKSDNQTYQKSPKVSKQRTLEFIDISSMTYPSAGGKKHWLLIVDEATDYAHSLFLKKKNDMIETMLMWVKILFMKHHIRIKKIRLDNSGENRMFQTKPDQQNMGIKFEFTAPGTPQQNSVVERKFPTLMGRARAMMNHAGFDDNFNKKFWCEAKPPNWTSSWSDKSEETLPTTCFSKNIQNTENISEFWGKLLW